MPKKKLPIGIQSFKVIREDNYYYVDKTPFVKKLVDEGKYFFLSRPRRFGKSLFLDTLRQAFLGRKDLFQGLYLENNWDWDQKYPVVHVSFGAGVVRSKPELVETFFSILRRHEQIYDLSYIENLPNKQFEELIFKLSKKYNQKVVVLIDEYDKPILDNITKPDVAIPIREELKNFYSVLKDMDEHLKFCFVTGVSKFSKVSIFSGLNNLKDITLHPECATICGYTQDELESVFQDRLDEVDLAKVKEWYDGYNFLGERVYNPFDVLLYLDSKIFRPYWFETGTPTFLIELLFKKQFSLSKLELLEVGEEILDSFDVNSILPENVLFQTGYLTIQDVYFRGNARKFKLCFPNLEVKMSFTNSILNTFSDLTTKEHHYDDLYYALEKGAVSQIETTFKSIFASIPHDWFRKNNLQEYEGFYASVFYAYFCGLGLDVRVEEVTNFGQVDMTVIFDQRCYLFEFKVVEKADGRSLSQLKEKKYYEKYQGKFAEIYLIGVEFGKEERNVVGYYVDKL